MISAANFGKATGFTADQLYSTAERCIRRRISCRDQCQFLIISTGWNFCQSESGRKSSFYIRHPRQHQFQRCRSSSAGCGSLDAQARALHYGQHELRPGRNASASLSLPSGETLKASISPPHHHPRGHPNLRQRSPFGVNTFGDWRPDRSPLRRRAHHRAIGSCHARAMSPGTSARITGTGTLYHANRSDVRAYLRWHRRYFYSNWRANDLAHHPPQHRRRHGCHRHEQSSTCACTCRCHGRKALVLHARPIQQRPHHRSHRPHRQSQQNCAPCSIKSK